MESENQKYTTDRQGGRSSTKREGKKRSLSQTSRVWEVKKGTAIRRAGTNSKKKFYVVSLVVGSAKKDKQGGVLKSFQLRLLHRGYVKTTGRGTFGGGVVLPRSKFPYRIFIGNHDGEKKELDK